MKCYEDSSNFNNEKHKAKEWNREHKAGGFRCSHCRQFVVINDLMGTANRNHCNACLWSKHVDVQKGDRRSLCQAGMEPIGLTFKHEGLGKQGEIMLIHLCSECQKISINRIARDDCEEDILAILGHSLNLDTHLKHVLEKDDIYLLDKNDEGELRRQLFGV